MVLRFTKADAASGVDPHFTADDPRVIVRPDEMPAPLYPDDAGFWDQFSDTVAKACLAHDGARYIGGVSPALEGAGIRNGRRAADLVHSDWPTDVMLIGAKYATSGYRSFAALQQSVFTDKVVLLNRLMAEAAWRVSPSSFAAKWHFMVPRPEEVAGAIARDEIDAPDQIKLDLFDMVGRDELIADQRKFTVYPEGSPNHPSYNAMHSAAAGASVTVIKVMLDLTEEDRSMIDLTARNMAYFRTVAGVHYPQDNAAGLWLGQEVVNRWLPGELMALGVSASEVESALAAAQTDWLS